MHAQIVNTIRTHTCIHARKNRTGDDITANTRTRPRQVNVNTFSIYLADPREKSRTYSRKASLRRFGMGNEVSFLVPSFDSSRRDSDTSNAGNTMSFGNMVRRPIHKTT